jgi:glycosyltransferase involved in cell wall biosynthesis
MPKERYRVVRNGVDIERFRPRNLDDRVALRIANDIPPLAKVVGMFASMKEQKNHLTLIRAAEIAEQSTPGIIYLLIGGELELGQRQTSAYAAELGELVLRSPIRNQFRVLGKRSDVEDLYPCCDLTVLPSWHEGFPNVLLESMACGVGFVASDVADNRWIAETYQAGAIVPPGDAESLARQIVQGLDAHGPFSTSGCLERVRSDIARSNMVAKQQAIYRETA